MANTRVHLPADIRTQLEAMAARDGTTPNALIVEPCRRFLAQASREWPEEFFRNDHLSRADLAELRAGGEQLERTIRAARRSKSTGRDDGAFRTMASARRRAPSTQ